jgi:uncharacterized protein YpmS
MSDTLIVISLTIGQGTYKLKIPSNKESQIRTSVSTLNATIKKYVTDFPGQKEQDYIAMAFIAFIAEQSPDATQNASLIEDLKTIETLL